ncbi:response regulator transcription factor [Aggregatilinea lenta]|uniref:response regulator transcription factor n=1 Tax=Aggregatilinea lenta TaxID=913108 RepID=UPI000E5C462B|nr:response regulator transcription factor [Aggregatilinea lenta]
MSKQQTILVVDDEATLREVVRRYLERETFRVIEADSGAAALRLLREERPDLIVLDVMLPGLDGFALARRLRDPADRGVILVEGSVPIVMLTARSEEADRLAGFELGADDYVVKPFSPRELVMRIKAVLRRAAPDMPQSVQPLVVGDLMLDPAAHTARRGAAEIALTAKEFELLWFLANHPHQVFTRAQLLDHVWDYDYYGDESTVTVHIRRLREKIEPDPGAPIYLQTVWGVGYKFEGPA